MIPQLFHHTAVIDTSLVQLFQGKLALQRASMLRAWKEPGGIPVERGRRDEAVQIRASHGRNMGYLRCGACKDLGPAPVLLSELGSSGNSHFKISISGQFHKFE